MAPKLRGVHVCPSWELQNMKVQSEVRLSAKQWSAGDMRATHQNRKDVKTPTKKHKGNQLKSGSASFDIKTPFFLPSGLEKTYMYKTKHVGIFMVRTSPSHLRRDVYSNRLPGREEPVSVYSEVTSESGSSLHTMLTCAGKAHCLGSNLESNCVSQWWSKRGTTSFHNICDIVLVHTNQSKRQHFDLVKFVLVSTTKCQLFQLPPSCSTFLQVFLSSCNKSSKPNYQILPLPPPQATWPRWCLPTAAARPASSAPRAACPRAPGAAGRPSAVGWSPIWKQITGQRGKVNVN